MHPKIVISMLTFEDSHLFNAISHDHVTHRLWLRAKFRKEKAFLPLTRVQVAHHHIPPFLKVSKISRHQPESQARIGHLTHTVRSHVLRVRRRPTTKHWGIQDKVTQKRLICYFSLYYPNLRAWWPSH